MPPGGHQLAGLADGVRACRPAGEALAPAAGEETWFCLPRWLKLPRSRTHDAARRVDAKSS